MPITYKVLLVAGLMCIQISAATTSDDRSLSRTFTDGFSYTVNSPDLRRHWAFTAAGVLLALPFDQKVMPHRRKLMPNSVARFGDLWGGRWAVITVLPFMYLADRNRGVSAFDTRRRVRFAVTSLVAVGATTALLKWAIGRERPNHARRHLSFPSGHTSAAFSVAEVMRVLYGNRVGTPFYLAAVITGISRIHDNRHFPSDVVAGAGLGVGMIKGFRIAQQKADPQHPLRLSITSTSLSITYLF
ncbi:MAG: phosphatase PAP2 family protein [Candidatus Neomarinimicrobiota bacterium]